MTRLRVSALTFVALAAAASVASAAGSPPDSVAATPAATPAAASTVIRHSDGSISVHPGERFTEYFVAGRDSSGRLRMRCVQGADRAQLLMRNRALWLRPRATK